MDIILKEVTEDYLPQVKKLLKDNDLPYEDISSKKNCLYLGYKDSRFIGMGGLEIHDDYALLRSLVIEESVRGEGYGKALCNKLIKYAEEKRIAEIYLLTMTAEAFFAKLGFRKEDRNSVPPAIQKTSEFANLCPESAVCMILKIRS